MTGIGGSNPPTETKKVFMATRSKIGIICPELGGKVKSIYCHWDGYYSGVGKTLYESYSDEISISQLISHGGCSALRKTIVDSVFYHDRGEELVISEYESKQDFFNREVEEYNYLFDTVNGKWLVSKYGSSQLMELEPTLWLK